MTNHHSRSHFLCRIGALLFCFAVLTAPSLAQNNKGTIVGTARDPNGAVVKDATVSVTNTATGETRQATTGDDGSYSVPALEPGRYRVTLEAPGFQTVTVNDVTLETNARLPVDATFTVGGAGETVNVTGDTAPLTESETSVRGEVITGRQVVDLPLPQRNFTVLAALTPGVSRPAASTLGGGGNFANGGPGESTESTRFRESGGSVIVANGARPTNNNFTLDGIDNNETQFGQIAIYPNPDAIREFKVETSVYSAESGRAGGAIISTTFKSGTNGVHGDLYEFYQGRFASALPSNLKGQSFIPNSNTHNFGGVVGGPVFLPRPGEGGKSYYDGRNRTFFFFSYNGQRSAKPIQEFAFVNVPTRRQRQGDFSELLVPGQTQTFNTVRGPVTAPVGTIFDANGNPFPGNIIPRNLFSSSAFTFLNAYPFPTESGLVNNYRRKRSERATGNGYDVRIDHNITKANTIFGRFSRQDTDRLRENNFPLGTSPNNNDLPSGFGAGTEFGKARQIALGDTHVFSPSVINDARAGYHRVSIGIFNTGVGGAGGYSPSIASQLGFNNVNVCGLLCSGITLLGVVEPNYSLEFTGDGGPFFFVSNNFFFGDTLTLVKGKQTFRVGGDLRVRQNQQVDGGRNGGTKGNVQYGTGVGGFASGNFGSIPVGPNDSGSAVANLLLGYSPAFITRGNPGGPFLLSNKEIDFYVQDDLKVRPDLTLNLGLRYDLFTLPTERYNRQSNFDPATGNLVVAGRGSLGRNLGRNDKNNFGPRIGFAYSGLRENKTLVVRGGYGLTYALDISGRPPLSNNPGFAANYSSSINQFGTPGNPLPARFNLDTGYPFPIPILPTGATYRPAQSDTVFFVNPNNKTEMFHQYNLTLQDEFAKNWLAEIAYVGALGRNLLVVRNIGNSSTSGPGSRQVSNVDIVFDSENTAKSSYNAFQSKLEKRFSQGLSIISTYVWSHAIDNSPGAFAGLGNIGGNFFGYSNPLRPELDRGNSDFDTRHRFTFASVFDLPVGRGRRFGGGMSKAADFFIGGFQLNTNITVQSGPVYSVRAGDPRADLIGDPTPTADQRARGLQLNPNAFRAARTPIFSNDPNGPKFGTLGRNTFRGQRQEFVDASLFKNFRLQSISELFNVQLRAQVFNLFNHVNRSTPNRDLNDTTNFGRDTSEQNRRQLEFGLKVIF